MRHFNYFENGGPTPSICLSCGNTKELFDLGRELPVAGGMAQLCKKCVAELAYFIGFVPEAPVIEKIEKLEAEIVSHETALARIPNHVEDLINGIRSVSTDFVFAISGYDSVSSSAPVSDDAASADGSNEAGETAPRERKASK